MVSVFMQIERLSKCSQIACVSIILWQGSFKVLSMSPSDGDGLDKLD